MMKASLTLAAALAILAGPAWAQEDKAPEKSPKEQQKQEEDAFLSPQEAVKLLEEIEGYMTKAEELLNDSAQGKSLVEQENAAKKIQKLLEEPKPSDPASLQQNALKTIEKLMKKSEGKQQGAIEKLGELIKRARG